MVSLQVSVVQGFGVASSAHATPLAFFASVGQVSVVPSHFSSTSHSPPAARHTKLADCFESVQVAEAPEQKSATSHAVPFALFGYTHAPVAGLHVAASWH